MNTRHPPPRTCHTGFGMVEVLVTLFVISVGLLGVAKMHALALGSTKVSGSRALASILASSMASAMQANRAYWGSPSATTAGVGVSYSGSTFSVTTTSVLSGDTTLSGPSVTGTKALDCSTNACLNPASPNTSSLAMAIYDLTQWGFDMAQTLPIPTGTGATRGFVQCTLASSSTTPPSTSNVCNVTVTWSEKTVSGIVSSTTATSTTASDQQLVLVVEVPPP
ncbi:MAG: hypothetical protein JOY84_15935 [Curvibacter sp.]|nr:hypothetical protein [Curvibacter sp.]